MPIDFKPTEAMAGQSWANEKSRQIDTESESVVEMEHLESGVYLLKKLASGQVQKWQKI
jgi:hypothetical protein